MNQVKTKILTARQAYSVALRMAHYGREMSAIPSGNISREEEHEHRQCCTHALILLNDLVERMSFADKKSSEYARALKDFSEQFRDWANLSVAHSLPEFLALQRLAEVEEEAEQLSLAIPKAHPSAPKKSRRI